MRAAAAAAAGARSPPAAEIPLAHHHETRPRRGAGAAAGYDTRDPSPGGAADASLVVRLRVGRDRLRRWLRARQLGRPMGPAGGSHGTQQQQGHAQGYGDMGGLDGAQLPSSLPSFATRQQQQQQYGRPGSPPPASRFAGSYTYPSDGGGVDASAADAPASSLFSQQPLQQHRARPGEIPSPTLPRASAAARARRAH